MAKFTLTGVNFGGPDDDWYWFYWWNWLTKPYRYTGYVQDWYDRPISSIGFWFFNWTWALPFTKHKGDKSFLYYAKKTVDT